jgi:hypothetical protein
MNLKGEFVLLKSLPLGLFNFFNHGAQEVEMTSLAQARHLRGRFKFNFTRRLALVKIQSNSTSTKINL